MFVKKFNKTKCINGCELFNDNSNYLYWENRNVTNIKEIKEDSCWEKIWFLGRVKLAPKNLINNYEAPLQQYKKSQAKLGTKTKDFKFLNMSFY